MTARRLVNTRSLVDRGMPDFSSVEGLRFSPRDARVKLRMSWLTAVEGVLGASSESEADESDVDDGHESSVGARAIGAEAAASVGVAGGVGRLSRGGSNGEATAQSSSGRMMSS